MRMNKFFMLGIAGLAFAACSNEEEVANNQDSGLECVTVKLVSPTTRSVKDATNVDEVTVTGNITVKLEAASPTGDDAEITVSAADIASGAVTAIKFWNVSEPRKVTAEMNGGQADYSAVDITTLQAEPASIPAYGEATVELTGDSESPALDDTDGIEDVNATDDDKGIKFQMYKANIKMEIPVARLEVSGIVHVDGDNSCEYSTLSIAGVYLDDIYAKGGDTKVSDYQYPDATHGTGADAILFDAATVTDFKTVDGVWPETQGKVYAYNFYAPTTGYSSIKGINATSNPTFKIYFNNAAGATTPKSSPRYAMITSFGKTMEAGKVYRITSARIEDKNILGSEGGETVYGVSVTLEEAVWTVETLDNVTWADDGRQ